jgi:hypothetical protein
MQDAMTIWQSICGSKWFKSASIVSLNRIPTDTARGQILTIMFLDPVSE